MQTQALETPPARLAPAEVVRAAFDAYNRGDLDESRRFLAPDLQWILPPTALHSDVVYGPEAFVRVLKSELEAFSEIRREPRDLEEHGDIVVAVVESHLRGRASGIELETRAEHAFTVRDGQILRAEQLA